MYFSESMKQVHDASCLKINDQLVLKKFLHRAGLMPGQERQVIISGVADTFSKIPYENLTKIIKSDAVVSPRSAMRFPDELLGDWLRWGTGGTCFSLTAAIVAVYDALGIEAHPVLADRHYGPDTHCGLIIVEPHGLLLLDPGYLLFTPVLLSPDKVAVVENGHNRIEVKPVGRGDRFELYTVFRGNRKLRLSYKIRPIDSMTFSRCWEQSFAWEMMTYPVLTRTINGNNQYLSGP
jgi:hypothetical protein